MNKSELIDSVVNATGDSKSAVSAMLDATLGAITDAVKNDEKVQLTGFGTFERRHRKARVGRNPQTGAEVQIKAANVPAFKAGKAFKDTVNS
ncbi:DNA-binding protein HU-alpha [bacterium BMS3Bbin02]|nr:DNA-binding protein HU-alpha [bacterium BMS3Bbin02]